MPALALAPAFLYLHVQLSLGPLWLAVYSYFLYNSQLMLLVCRTLVRILLGLGEHFRTYSMSNIVVHYTALYSGF